MTFCTFLLNENKNISFNQFLMVLIIILSFLQVPLWRYNVSTKKKKNLIKYMYVCMYVFSLGDGNYFAKKLFSFLIV